MPHQHIAYLWRVEANVALAGFQRTDSVLESSDETRFGCYRIIPYSISPVSAESHLQVSMVNMEIAKKHGASHNHFT